MSSRRRQYSRSRSPQYRRKRSPERRSHRDYEDDKSRRRDEPDRRRRDDEEDRRGRRRDEGDERQSRRRDDDEERRSRRREVDDERRYRTRPDEDRDSKSRSRKISEDGDRKPAPLPQQRREKDVSQPTSAYPGSKTVWIGSVSDGIGEDAIFEEMNNFGDISGMRLIAQRGFGYVRYLEEEAANQAIRSRGVDVNGRRIRIDACEDMPTLPHPYRPIPGSKPPSCSTLFVGNLPGDTTEEDVMSFFNQHLGPVGITIQSISLRKGGFKGMAFAHVRFASGDDCEQAVPCVAGSLLKGARIRIDWAVDKPTMERATMNAELRGKTNKIFIAGLNDSIEESDVTQAFATFGEITSVRLNRDKAGVRSFGYIAFTSPESAINAVEKISSISIRGVRMRGDYAKPDRPPVAAERPRERSRSPDYPRYTRVSYIPPPEYGPMRSWIDCYGKNMVNGSIHA